MPTDPEKILTYNSAIETLTSIDSQEERIAWAASLPLSVLELVSDYPRDEGWTVAHYLAGNDLFPEENITEDILRISNGKGRLVAHVLAMQKKLPARFFTLPVLSLKDLDGDVVAHSLVWKYEKEELDTFLTGDILRIANDDGWSAAHILVRRNALPERFLTEDVLLVAAHSGWTVAHELAVKGTLPERFIFSPEGILNEDIGMRTAHLEYFDRRPAAKTVFDRKSALKTVFEILIENDAFPVSRLTPDIARKKCGKFTIVRCLAEHLLALKANPYEPQEENSRTRRVRTCLKNLSQKTLMMLYSEIIRKKVSGEWHAELIQITVSMLKECERYDANEYFSEEPQNEIDDSSGMYELEREI